jgi:hypothetical protein
MNGSYDLEPGFDWRIADWLDDADVDRAPAWILETVLAIAPAIPQRHPLRAPRRSSRIQRFAILAAAVTALLVGLLGSALIPGRPPAPLPTVAPVRPSPASPFATSGPTASPIANGLPDGRLLLEHIGNAFDGSEFPQSAAGQPRRRFYIVDAHHLDPTSAVEFLPGVPATGKTAADVSTDGRMVVFQDATESPRLYQANLDGSAFRKLPVDCSSPCALRYPDFDPTGKMVVYVRVEFGRSWLEILDLVSGDTVALDQTERPDTDLLPEQPAWSPDGRTIAFSRLKAHGVPAENGMIDYVDVPSGGSVELVDVVSGAVTDLHVPLDLRPGDVAWSPDGRTLLFSDGPGSTMGSNDHLVAPGFIHRIGVDGSGLVVLRGWAGPEYLPDGSRILYQDNELYSMLPDGTDARKVSSMDLTTDVAGYVYIVHWLPPS